MGVTWCWIKVVDGGWLWWGWGCSTAVGLRAEFLDISVWGENWWCTFKDKNAE
jgi:hypothetical protein